MGLTMFYLAVGFMGLMAVPLDSKQDSNQTQSNTIQPSSSTVTSEKTNASTTQYNTIASNKAQNAKTTTNQTEKRWLDNNVTQMGGGVILLCLVISNMVLSCCICSLRRRVSSWANPRSGNPTDATQVRYVVGDAEMPADRPVEPSTIYTVLDEPAREGNSEEVHNTEGAGATEADPANGGPRSPEQAEALLPEPPAEVAEPPADDVTDALLVV